MATDNRPHDAVKHPFANVQKGSDKLMDFLANRLLASSFMFYLALILPILVLPAPDWIKAILMIISGNWIQWWALPALQRRQNQVDAKADLKADADHATWTHMANVQDTNTELLQSVDRKLTMLLHPSAQAGTNE